MSPFCPDDKKYGVVDSVIAYYQSKFDKGEKVMGLGVTSINTVNGVRITLADGTWGLIRASSNKPSLVVVVESPVSSTQMHAMFDEINSVLGNYPDVGEYDQRLEKAA